MSFDPKCHDLALLFLQEVANTTDADVNELAQAIQDTIEDFIKEKE